MDVEALEGVADTKSEDSSGNETKELLAELKGMNFVVGVLLWVGNQGFRCHYCGSLINCAATGLKSLKGYLS